MFAGFEQILHLKIAPSSSLFVDLDKPFTSSSTFATPWEIDLSVTACESSSRGAASPSDEEDVVARFIPLRFRFNQSTVRTALIFLFVPQNDRPENTETSYY